MSRKLQREQERANAKIIREANERRSEELHAGQKRKRSDVDEADPKLKEFLEVMQPTSKSKDWLAQRTDDPAIQSPRKVQAIELPGAESDEEYEAVPKKSRHKSPPKHSIPSNTAISEVPTEPAIIDKTMILSIAPDATDEDWLRGKKNRLLDLMDPDDIPSGPGVKSSSDTQVAVEIPMGEPNDSEESLKHNHSEDGLEADAENNEEVEHDKSDLVMEAIKSHGRLFVRNLPYTATEDDLRKHFEPFGALDEVSTPCPSFSIVLFHDEYPDRDSLCLRACDVNWTNILVDASCFLKTSAFFREFVAIEDRLTLTAEFRSTFLSTL